MVNIINYIDFINYLALIFIAIAINQSTFHSSVLATAWLPSIILLNHLSLPDKNDCD